MNLARIHMLISNKLKIQAYAKKIVQISALGLIKEIMFQDLAVTASDRLFYRRHLIYSRHYYY